MLERILRSPALKAGSLYVLGGLCFAAANLIFARALTPGQFAIVALVLALVETAKTLGPVGADTLVNRNVVDPNAGLLRQIVLFAAVAGIGAGYIAWIVYRVSAPVAALTAVIAAAASVNVTGAAFFRSRGRYTLALGMTQGHNAVLAVAATAVLLSAQSSLMLPFVIMMLGYLASAVLGWAGAFRLDRRPDALAPGEFPWADGRTIIGTTLAILIMLQFERLAIPKLLDNEALATFAVLASIAGSPFRVLQMGVGFTLIPQLRNAANDAEVSAVLRSEARVIGGLATVAAVVIWIAARPFLDWFLDGKYDISQWMVAAAMLSGFGKILGAFGSSVSTALGTADDLAKVRSFAWLAVLVAVAGALAGSAYGLVGVLFGVSAGWSLYALQTLRLASRVIARRHPG